MGKIQVKSTLKRVAVKKIGLSASGEPLDGPKWFGNPGKKRGISLFGQDVGAKSLS